MPSILDLVLIGEISVITAVVVQTIKSHPRVKGSDVVWWTGPIGILLCVMWFAALGKLDEGAFIINFRELYRAIAIGVVGAVGRSKSEALAQVVGHLSYAQTNGAIDSHRSARPTLTRDASNPVQ